MEKRQELRSMPERERERENIIKKLQEDRGGETLWEAIVLFEGYSFRTVKDLEFQYTVSGGEIFIDRKQKSKSITKSTVLMAYANACRLMSELGFVKGPKKLETFGASYLYPMFLHFGVIRTAPYEDAVLPCVQRE